MISTQLKIRLLEKRNSYLPDHTPEFTAAEQRHCTALDVARKIQRADRAFSMFQEAVHAPRPALPSELVDDFELASHRHLMQIEATGMLLFTHLRDALGHLNDIGARVDDTGPLIERHGTKEGKKDDLTALIAAARNVACHFDDPNRHVSKRQIDRRRQQAEQRCEEPQRDRDVAPGLGGNVAWTFLGPREEVFISRSFRNQTDDDVLLVFGDCEIYLQNNVGKAIERACENIVNYV